MKLSSFLKKFQVVGVIIANALGAITRNFLIAFEQIELYKIEERKISSSGMKIPRLSLLTGTLLISVILSFIVNSRV